MKAALLTAIAMGSILGGLWLAAPKCKALDHGFYLGGVKQFGCGPVVKP